MRLRWPACESILGCETRDGVVLMSESREVHREQLSIEHSMRDLDSAVGRLDNILMSLYFVIVILIFAVALVSNLCGPLEKTTS